MKYQLFDMHFDLEMKYNTSQRYLVDIKKKELIHVLKSNTKIKHFFFPKVFFLGTQSSSLGDMSFF